MATDKQFITFKYFNSIYTVNRNMIWALVERPYNDPQLNNYASIGVPIPDEGNNFGLTKEMYDCIMSQLN